MRIVYIDCDSLRPDHLGCYGYHRATSPNIDRLARQGVRFDNCYASDTPCAPSRTSLFCGRFGIHNGVVCHCGTAADMPPQGITRGFQSTLGQTAWMSVLRQAGLRTASVSSFGERHSAWWWYAGFNDILNSGGNGNEGAEVVAPLALEWLKRHARQEKWFLHVNFWDAHTPYRTPASYGEPFADDPIPAWYTEDLRLKHWSGCGPQCARERGAMDGTDDHQGRYPRQPHVMDSMREVRRMFDGYDTAVRYIDDHIGRLLNELADQGVLDDTAVIVAADHGECLGEMNIYGCHQLADQITTRIPMIVRWPGITTSAPRVDDGLYYHLDLAATVSELAGGEVPGNWDGRSLAPALTAGRSAGRMELVLAHAQGSCQRSLRFVHQGRPYLCIRTYHDGYHGLPDVLLFDLHDDPHELNDLADRRPELVEHALARIAEWRAEAMAATGQTVDPMDVVLAEGGPAHWRGQLPRYLERLRGSGRENWAELLEARHAAERRV